MAKERRRGTSGRRSTRGEQLRWIAEADREVAEAARRDAESRRASAESIRVDAEGLRRAAERARAYADDARRAAEQARKDRDEILRVAEVLRLKAETGRAAAERTRRAASDQFDTNVRRAIRDEVEVATEMMRSEAAMRGERSSGRTRAAGEATRPTKRRAKPANASRRQR